MATTGAIIHNEEYPAGREEDRGQNAAARLEATMRNATPARAHLIAGGFPRGALAGHDIDYVRLRILQLLQEKEVLTSVGNDFHSVEHWLPQSQLLITYVAGPVLDDEQNRFVRKWLEDGGRWLGLHGSSGGKAARRGNGSRRRMVKMGHHETLGAFFLNHPPVRKFQVDVADPGHPLMKDLPESFATIDEPYMIEVQHPSTTAVLLTAALGPDNSPPGFGFAYDQDTALQADGKTRVLGFTRAVGKGGVTYVALGHAHSPLSNSQPFVDSSVEASGVTPTTLRVTWETDAYLQLLRNAIDWGTRRGP